jgi:hypothetical protein
MRGVSQAIEAAGPSLLYLPPYSPDFNPIENAFSKLKAPLRVRAERTIPASWDAVGSLLDRFTPAECANSFAAAGYEPAQAGYALEKAQRGAACMPAYQHAEAPLSEKNISCPIET